MANNQRLTYSSVPGADSLFTNAFIDYLTSLHDKFTDRVLDIRKNRSMVLSQALNNHVMPSHLPASKATRENWQVPQVPYDLLEPGIEITGPSSITGMFINALNPGPGGERATGDLDDDEDASGHRFKDTIASAINRLAAVNRTLEYTNSTTGKHYLIQDGDLPFFMHREKGLHLDEHEVSIDNKAIPSSILGTALTLFHTGRAQIELGKGVYFYLPKMESSTEAGFWRDFFDFSRAYLNLPATATIRAIPLIESLPAAYQMEEMLYELGPYAAGLNAARWDLKASIFEFIMTDPNSVWPDRFGVDIKTTEFLANIFRRLVAICLKHGAVPIGGMATALPSNDDEVNLSASVSIRADKEWEAAQGFVRAWVAHIFHMDTAAKPFKDLRSSGWAPTEAMSQPDNYPVNIETPKGSITVDGTRRNARMLLEYLEGWLNGRGAKGIDSLEGRSGIHPPLMEDLATGRMSVAQIAQRIIHKSSDFDTGETHSYILVKQLLQDELEDILRTRKSQISNKEELLATEQRYRNSQKIALRWIHNYVNLDFTSLASYSRKDLLQIAGDPDAF